MWGKRRIVIGFAVATVVATVAAWAGVSPWLAPARASASDGVQVSLDAPAEAAPNSDFTANVTISQVQNFDAAQYDVSFDHTVLQLYDVTAGLIGDNEIPVDYWGVYPPGGTPHTFRIINNVPGLNGATGSGHMAMLQFHVIGSQGQSSNIGLSKGVLSSIMAENITATWTGGLVNMTSVESGGQELPPASGSPPDSGTTEPTTQTQTLSALVPASASDGVQVSLDASAEAAANSNFTATVAISQVEDFDACNYDVSFDPSVLRLDNVTDGNIGGTVIPVGIWTENVTGTYRVIQNIPGLNGATGSGHLAILQFHVVGSQGQSSDIGLSNGVLSSIMAEAITATWTGSLVQVTSAEAGAQGLPSAPGSPPESATAPTSESAPAPSPPAPPPPSAQPKAINWPILGGVIGGVVIVLGLIIFFLVRRMSY